MTKRVQRSVLVVLAMVAALGVAAAPTPAGAQTDPCDISNFTDGTEVNTAGYLTCLGAQAQLPDPANCPSADNFVAGVADPYQVTPGATTTVSYYGFSPNSQVEIIVGPSPVSVGSFTADNLGNVVQTVAIPAGTSLGAHTVAAVGEDGEGRGSLVACAAINVVSADAPVTTQTAGALPRTGSDTGRMVAVGGALVLLGAAALVGSLRGRRSVTA